MGRAIVREPPAFLMDEPLSNLDAKLRVSMRAQLSRLHERLGVTTVYVTHDQVEAMTLGQRVAVLERHAPAVRHAPALFDNPADLFVAAFIGCPAMDPVEADDRGGQRRASTPAALARAVPRYSRFILGVRPHDLPAQRAGPRRAGAGRQAARDRGRTS